MTKAQTLIVEFILFFAISFSLFATISFFFYLQNETLQKMVAEYSSQLINDLVSSDVLSGIRCKACDSVSIKDDIPSRIGGQYYRIELDQLNLNTTLLSEKPYSNQDSLYNLNETFTLSGQSTSENKIIGIQIKNRNWIEVE